jgi:ABC-type transport system involved in cytochrome bd biosynthesis fused ATPase/permease subunit
VLICGPNGSGKSVLLDIMAGLYVPTTGLVQLDGANSRQIAVEDFQQAISYARQSAEFFHGPVFQNLQMAWPTLTREDAQKALAEMQLAEELDHLPEGMDTRLSEQVRKTLSEAVASGISLVRCFARPAAIYLLDDPAKGLDAARLWAFEKTLSRLKGQHTVVMTGHAPEQIRQADHFIYLDKGRVLLNDRGPGGRRKLQALIDKDKGDKHEG